MHQQLGAATLADLGLYELSVLRDEVSARGHTKADRVYLERIQQREREVRRLHRLGATQPKRRPLDETFVDRLFTRLEG